MAAALVRAGPLAWTELGTGPSYETGSIAAKPAAWGDVILARKETPTSYHLAVVVDDAAQDVSVVVRGQDLFHATSVHRLLQALLGLTAPTYHHHRLILGADGNKLSKSTRATGLRELRAGGANCSGHPQARRARLNAASVAVLAPGLGMAKRKTRKRPRQGRKGRKARPRLAKAPAARAVEAALAGVAHDIRTPLTGIVALAELLATSDVGTREREWANAIKSGADHLATLTTLIVDAVKADAAGITLRHEPFSPRRLAEAVGHALTARAGNKGIKTEIAVAADLPAMVAGDVLRLRAALENLADNAVKFTSAGTVVFTAGAKPVGRKRVRLIFTVADTGIGIASGRDQKSVSSICAGERSDRAPLWRRRPWPGLYQAHRPGDGRRT